MPDGTQSATAARPGTAFHAPQARLVTEAGTPVTIDDRPITPDIISVKVTLLNSGVSQVEAVLNNQRHDRSNRPVMPPWRYNGLAKVGFGSRLRVDMRYGAEGWTPMILARITDMTFTFPSDAGPQVTLKGDDLASLLRVNPAEPKDYLDHEIGMVADVLNVSGSGLRLAANRPSPEFSTKIFVTRKQDSTYLKFIETFAERMDYEIFVAFDNPEPGRAAPNPTEADPRSISFHFEPARSKDLDKVVELRRCLDIIDFNPKFTVWDLLTGAIARGSVPRGRGSFNEEVALADAINDLHGAPDGGATPISAAAARASAFADENRPEENRPVVSEANLDRERTVGMAIATLRASARSFLTADVSTIGFTRLRPGIHVNLSGFDAPFDGIYYVTKTIHTLNATGYRTVSSLRRPGMLDPKDYPGI